MATYREDDEERRGPVVAEHTLEARDVRLGYGE
ncbi:ABC transporter ATP-binding protein, partial [Streptomyces sp. SID4931]|nr:ABC transporter ATP-binding protein [Streptomyces sp. SID4931]